MIMVNIADAKAKLSELLDAVSRGEQVIVCNRNAPVVELRPIEAPRKAPRNLTPLYADWTIEPTFFEPLDGDELETWYGEPDAKRSRVAESRTPYPSRRRRRRGRQ
jgi:prevent-host-death family protein